MSDPKFNSWSHRRRVWRRVGDVKDVSSAPLKEKDYLRMISSDEAYYSERNGLKKLEQDEMIRSMGGIW